MPITICHLRGHDMAVYNTIIAKIRCPHCGVDDEQDIFVYFGKTCHTLYRIGDTYEWEEGDRPEEICFAEEGYCECLSCKKDFFVTVCFHTLVISDVRADGSKAGFLS